MHADPEPGDRRAHGEEPGDRILVQAAAGEDLDLVQTGVIQELPRLDGEVCKIAGIEPDGLTLKSGPSSRAKRITFATPSSVS